MEISNSRIKEPFGDRIFMIVVYMMLTVCLLIVIYPLIYIISSSFSSTKAVVSGAVWLLPVEPTLKGYAAIFNNPQVYIGYKNTIIYTFFGTLVNVVMTVMFAYPLARRTFYGRNLFTLLLVFTMLFSGGLIPFYMVVKSLGFLDTRWAMILPSALSVWQVIIARTFFQTTIPDELTEAAQLDGCSDIGFIWRVVLPLSKPIIAVLVLMYAVGHWNTYFSALIFLRSPDLYPLQIVLRNILILNQIDPASIADVEDFAERQGLADLLKYSLIVVANGPILLIYPFAQKYFVKGVLIGSLKG